MEELNIIIKVITIIIAVIIYIGIWWSLKKNWDIVCTDYYGDLCFEKNLHYFYWFWIFIHVWLIASGILVLIFN